MPLLLFAIVTALVFLIADAFMIPLVMQPLFKAALGAAMLDDLRLVPAAMFYIVHIAGLVYFAGQPTLRGGSSRMAFLNGAILGFVAYSCYEMTSYTIMRDWTLQLVIIDLGWGTMISGVASWAGALVIRMTASRQHSID
ncbi:MAG: DUF2177 family protein [Beijerinckiaceae bacterium]